MINNKLDFLKSLSEDEFNNGAIKVTIKDKNGFTENVWAYQPQNGDKSIAILLNTPASDFPIMRYGDEIKLKYCDGVAMLDNDWLEEEKQSFNLVVNQF